MSHRHTERNDASRLFQCEGKERFESFELVKKVAKRSRRNNGRPKAVYRCRHCQGFHIGSKDKLTDKGIG